MRLFTPSTAKGSPVPEYVQHCLNCRSLGQTVRNGQTYVILSLNIVPTSQKFEAWGLLETEEFNDPISVWGRLLLLLVFLGGGGMCLGFFCFVFVCHCMSSIRSSFTSVLSYFLISFDASVIHTL